MVGARVRDEPAKPVGEQTSVERSSQNYGLAREIRELAEVFLVLSDRLCPAVGFAEQGDRPIEVVDAEDYVLDPGNRRSFHAGRSLNAPDARRLVFDDER